MIHQAYYFIKFLFQSNNAHGIHSPFVFDFYNKALRPDLQKNIDLFKKHKLFRSELINNNQTIEVVDFGAGSKKINDNQRKVRQIAKTAGLSKRSAMKLIQVTQFLQPVNILELGTSVGLGTAALAMGNREANIKTLEGCPSTSHIAQEMFEKYKLNNISIKTGDFKKTLPETLKDQSFDMIYFDGNHQKEPTLEYFNLCLSNKSNQSVFIFDDIHWSKEMNEAWNEIKNHPESVVTIDTFQWGIVFFRKEQMKQHFILRVW